VDHVQFIYVLYILQRYKGGRHKVDCILVQQQENVAISE